MEEEQLEQQPVEQAPEGAATVPAEAAPSSVTPAFDPEAERAKIRTEVEADIARQTQPPVAEEEDPADLIYTDPKRALELHGERVARQVMQAIQPDIQRLRQEQVVSDLSSGLGEHGKAYVQKLAGSIDPRQLTPELRDLVTSAAKFKDQEAAPKRMSPEPAYSQEGGVHVNRATLEFFTGKGFSPSEVAQMVKDGEIPTL